MHERARLAHNVASEFCLFSLSGLSESAVKRLNCVTAVDEPWQRPGEERGVRGGSNQRKFCERNFRFSAPLFVTDSRGTREIIVRHTTRTSRGRLAFTRARVTGLRAK